MSEPRDPRSVMPERIARALPDDPYWFVIGGQAVRCLAPYRPSRDVDLGVRSAADLDDLLEQLRAAGSVEVSERSPDTVHFTFDAIKVSIFVLEDLAKLTTDHRLTVPGILATKLHAILDRGMRRDFFDLYVTLCEARLGVVACLRAVRDLYGDAANEALLLRALCYFDDADREAPLPGEGAGDWDVVRDYFVCRVGDLLVPPTRALDIQARKVDVGEPRPSAPA